MISFEDGLVRYTLYQRDGVQWLKVESAERPSCEDNPQAVCGFEKPLEIPGGQLWGSGPRPPEWVQRFVDPGHPTLDMVGFENREYIQYREIKPGLPVYLFIPGFGGYVFLVTAPVVRLIAVTAGHMTFPFPIDPSDWDTIPDGKGGDWKAAFR